MTTTQHATFVIERSYSASPQRVFAAWRDPASKRAWFAAGEGWDIRSYELDFREGGREKSRFRVKGASNPFPAETTFGNETLFNEIIDNERIVFTYSMDRDGVRFSISLASVEMKPEGAGTRLIFTEQAAFFEGGDGPAQREQGWRELLGRLGDVLARSGQIEGG